MIVYIEAKDYYHSQKYLGSSTHDNVSHVVFYNDPFASNESGLSNFSNNFTK
jgi:hypothetical protein